MQNPLEITFHNMNSNEKIESLIHEKFENVKKISPDVTKCHIVIEKLSKQHQTGNTSCARLDLKVPHINDIVITEKCEEDESAIMTSVIKVFKRGKSLLREEVARKRERTRVPRADKFEVDAETAETQAG